MSSPPRHTERAKSVCQNDFSRTITSRVHRPHDARPFCAIKNVHDSTVYREHATFAPVKTVGNAREKSLVGCRVLILCGKFRGGEGVCLGKAADGLWAVSPDGSDEILSLEFEKDFGLCVDLSSDPALN